MSELTVVDQYSGGVLTCGPSVCKWPRRCSSTAAHVDIVLQGSAKLLAAWRISFLLRWNP